MFVHFGLEKLFSSFIFQGILAVSRLLFSLLEKYSLFYTTLGRAMDVDLMHQLDAADDRIEERLRQLKAVTSRLRHRQRYRQGQNSPPMENMSGETSSTSGQISTEELGAVSQERTFQPRTRYRSTYLVAKALEMDEDEEKSKTNNGSFFDCNICLDMPRDPIVTCCGHLFFWPCFYHLPDFLLGVKECPVCTGEVADSSITPVYGHGQESQSHKLKLKQAGLELPPRPPACRKEPRKSSL